MWMGNLRTAEDFSLDKHVSNVCKSCFFWLRQLRCVRRSLDIESVKTLVHAFVTSQVDYCNSVLALSPMTITDKLQRVLNSAAYLITATGKFDRGLSQLLHDDLHWRAPSYLTDYCVPVSTVPGRQHLRSASRRQLTVPRVRRSTFGARAFAIAGPTVWNSLPDSLRDPAVGPDQFWRDLKTHLFEWHCVSFSALAVFSRNALYKSTFYLLTDCW